jgi:hypothetical protein
MARPHNVTTHPLFLYMFSFVFLTLFCEEIFLCKKSNNPKAHFKMGSKVQISRNQFGLIWANWILELNSSSLLASWFSKSWALLGSHFFLGSKPIDFPSKMVPCRFSLNLPIFGRGPSFKGHGSNLWLSSNRIALFHWTLDLGQVLNLIGQLVNLITDT